MRSLEEINLLEKAQSLGAATLGVAASALIKRWRYGLRDNETFMRLAFLRWYSLSEPNWYNGLPVSTELPSIDTLIDEFGGFTSIYSELKFILTALATGYP